MHEMQNQELILNYLANELAKRKKKNTSYSLRSFARDLGIPAGRLSQYFSMKRTISKEVSDKLADALSLSPLQRQAWQLDENKYQFLELDQTQFEMISDPMHFEILTLMETENFISENKWIAKRLGYSTIEVSEALRRLDRIGLIKLEGKKWVLINKNGHKTTDGISSRAIKKAHKAQMEKCIDALDNISVDLRDITSILVATDPEQLHLVKEKIRKFRRSLSSQLSTHSKKEVYQLSIQFIPITKNGGNSENK